MKFRVSSFKFQVSGRATRNPELETGFTLLEVVVAMAIVGLGVVTLLEIFSLGLRLEARSAARTEAVAYGRQVMDKFLIRRALNAGEERGSFGSHHGWQLDIRPLRDETQLAPTGWDVNEITLRMRYREGERDKQLEMKTMRVLKRKNP